MAFSAFDSQPGTGSNRPERRAEQPSPADESFRALLDVVLQQTRLAQDEKAPEKLESLGALLELARRRRGEPFACDPVGIELVQTVLHKPFRGLIGSDDQWRDMTTQVAATLCEDPPSYDRLSALWRRLAERCDNGGK